jgi:hypothetical protein
VGLGGSALKVDPRTDLLYVGRAGDRRLSVYDPVGLIPVDEIELPAPASYLVIDDAENALLALLPDGVAVVDLTRRRVKARLDVPAVPFGLSVAGERY